MGKNKVFGAVPYDPMAVWVKDALDCFSALDGYEVSLRLNFCDEVELRVKRHPFLTVAMFRDLWQSLLLIGTYDGVRLMHAAEKYNIPVENFSDWAEVTSPENENQPLAREYRLFVKEALQLAREELQYQLEVGQG